jgi:hypothetical protein
LGTPPCQRPHAEAPHRWRELTHELGGAPELCGSNGRGGTFALVELEDLARIEIEGGYHEHVAVVVVDSDLRCARRGLAFLGLVLAVVNGKHLVADPAEAFADPLVVHNRLGHTPLETLEELRQFTGRLRLRSQEAPFTLLLSLAQPSRHRSLLLVGCTAY